MDNKVFNVKGRTIEQLEKAVDLLLFNEYGEYDKVAGWYFVPNKGLILTWYVGESQPEAKPFTNRWGQPEPISKEELVETLWNWLFTEQAKQVTYDELGDWDKQLNDSDVSENLGWRLYTDSWGHVEKTKHTIDHYSVAAFKPSWCWYGK
jgi:hypothetical protein